MRKGIIISGDLAQDHEFFYNYYRFLEGGIALDPNKLKFIINSLMFYEKL